MSLDLLRMGAARQHNAVSCGPYALRHALLYLGERHDVERIAFLAGTSDHGTWPWEMCRASEALGYKFGTGQWLEGDLARTRISYAYHEPARAAIRGHLDGGFPVIVCVDAQDHWITIVHATGRKVTVADSSYYGDHLQVVHELTWVQLLSRVCVWTPGRTRFDLYPVREL